MPLSTFPVVAYGTPEDIGAGSWTNNATPGVAATTDPFGGNNAYTLTDNDAGNVEGRLLAVAGLASDYLLWTPCLQAGSSSTSLFQFRDQTANDYPLIVSVSWSGGVPTLTPSSTGGNPTPTLYGTIPLGAGWYCPIIGCPWTPNNAGRMEVYATGNTVGLTGTTSYYLRNLVFLDLIDRARAFKRPKPGYLKAVGPSVREAWSYGNDALFTGQARWAPALPASDPVIKSGWFGENEATSVNAGILSMLAAGWDQQSLIFAKDRSNCASNVSSYLQLPGEDWDPDLERNWDYTFPFELVTSSLLSGI